MKLPAGTVGGLLHCRILSKGLSNVEHTVTMDNEACALAIISFSDYDRSPYVAILKRSNKGIYKVDYMLKGTTGKGFYVKDDGTGIGADGALAWKEVTIIQLSIDRFVNLN